MDQSLVQGYKSASQIARVLTEHWLAQNVYCPSCSAAHLQSCPNNSPVRDFVCTECSEQFELKSAKRNQIGKCLVDGAYHTMMARIQERDHPNFFFLGYDGEHYLVRQLVLIPKHFILPSMILPRKPLAANAKRAGWIGCSIDLTQLPEHGKILLVNQSKVMPSESVRQQWQSHQFLRDSYGEQKGWLVAILRYLDRLPRQFHLAQVYAFVPKLRVQFPIIGISKLRFASNYKFCAIVACWLLKVVVGI